MPSVQRSQGGWLSDPESAQAARHPRGPGAWRPAQEDSEGHRKEARQEVPHRPWDKSGGRGAAQTLLTGVKGQQGQRAPSSGGAGTRSRRLSLHLHPPQDRHGDMGPDCPPRALPCPLGTGPPSSGQEGRKDRGAGPSAQPGSGNPSPAPSTSGSQRPASKNRRGGGEGFTATQALPVGGSQSSLLPGGEHRAPTTSRGPAEQAWSVSGPVPEPTTH